LFGRRQGVMQIPEAGGTPTLLTKVDASLGETFHVYPQLLPGRRLLYLATNVKSENNAIYAAPLSDPSKRVLVMRSLAPALYASGGDGKEYLLTVVEQRLVAREFDSKTFTLGPPRALISQVVSSELLAAIANGTLVYTTGPSASHLQWL